MTDRIETPYKRTYPNGTEVWVARYTGPDGQRRYAKPAWNGGKSTFKLKRDAQRAINEAYGSPVSSDTVGGFFANWRQGGRSPRTHRENQYRIKSILDVPLDGTPLTAWALADLRRRHVQDLVEVMFTQHGRAPEGVRGVLRVLSVMFEDAITADAVDMNPVRGVRVRSSDRRAKKQARQTRVWTFEEMHEFAECAGRYEPLVRTLADTGMRLGEVLAVQREQFKPVLMVIQIDGSAYNGEIHRSSEEKNHSREIPIPPSTNKLLLSMPRRIDSPHLFPTPGGKLWWARNLYRDVWYPAQARWAGVDPNAENARGLVKRAGKDIRPHEMRHSFVSLMRQAGVPDADLAKITGHSVLTMVSKYTHALERSHDKVREVIG